jgi:SAM-dependent methyltransferase
MTHRLGTAIKTAKTITRKTLRAGYRAFVRVFLSFADQRFLDPNVPLSKLASHSKYLQYLTDCGNRTGIRILEIGSREVTGKSDARERFANAEYVGFDFYPGRNVDVVGDAHKLSQYFGNQRFDIIYSSAVFEHFAMPWVVATEIAKLLKPGGIVFVETHFSYGSHERPWHFFQFSDMALRVLFSPALGFECIEAGASNPMIGRFSKLADEYLRFMPITGLYCHCEFLGRKIRDVDSFDWNTVNLDDAVGDTKYPSP